MQLRDYQQEAVDTTVSFWKNGVKNVLVVLPTGAGKCLGIDTPVMMFDGSIKKVQDVKVGDQLMGPDSKPRNVLSLARGRETLYRVNQVKGDSYVVNESHILSLKHTMNKPCDERPTVNITVKDYLEKSNNFKHLHKGWKAKIDFNEMQINQEISPYLLGVWLGDGSSDVFSITTMDLEIANVIFQEAEKYGRNVRVEDLPNNKAKTYHVAHGARPFTSQLKELGLIKNKHVPDCYKLTSREVRRGILAGILDSDGHLSHNGFDVTLKHEKLMDDVIFIARSLGFRCNKKKVTKGIKSTGFKGEYFRTCITGDFSEIPFVRDKHRENIKPRSQVKDVRITGIKLEKLDVGDYYGFEIDGDRLFLLGDFTVTHNTVVLSKLIENVLNTYPGSSICAIAHRQELVSQMSVTLARNGIVHRVIGPNSVVKLCTRRHMEKLGKSFYDPNSRVAVAGVDTLVRRTEQLESWLPTVKLWVIDESHHTVQKNKWGTSVEMFPNALGLGVTATPERADGKGLGRHADGYFDEMHVGPPMRELINRGYLTPYRIYAPPSTLNLDGVRVSKTTGDFNPNDINKAVSESSLVSHDKAIVGDVVAHYKRLAMGKLCVVFAPSIEIAKEMEEDYVRNGIPARAIDGSFSDDERAKILDMFERREILVVINVALFDEGFDLPAIEVVQDAQPTQSYGRFVQKFGRSLRLMDGKFEAIFIDHVGNVHRHGGPPDRPREWTLDRRERRSSSEPAEVQVRTCLNLECMSVYERFRVECPYCGTPIPPPAERSLPEFVDGDLLELTPDAMEQLYGAVNHNTQSVEDYAKELEAKRSPQIGIMAGVKRQREKLEVVEDLKNVMAQWCGIERANGLTDSEIYRKFYITFGTDVLTPQTWKTSEMIKMKERVEHALTPMGA